MPFQQNTYFTGADAEIRLLTHPDPDWRGREVDCAYFQLTGGSSPIHIWNYARREGPAMSNAAQRERLDQLQDGLASGAPFDDTALSNARFELQLMVNETRFKQTYATFRSMSEIGTVRVRYQKQGGYGPEDLAEAGYLLEGGRVGSVGREVNVRDSVYPSVELTFADMRPLGSSGGTNAAPGAPREDSGPGPNNELQPYGLGRERGAKAFSVVSYKGWSGGEPIHPRLSPDKIPESLSGYDRLARSGSDTIKGVIDVWVPEAQFFGPVIEVHSGGQDWRVYRWQPTEGEDGQYVEVRPPTGEARSQIARKESMPPSTYAADTDTL